MFWVFLLKSVFCLFVCSLLFLLLFICLPSVSGTLVVPPTKKWTRLIQDIAHKKKVDGMSFQAQCRLKKKKKKKKTLLIKKTPQKQKKKKKQQKEKDRKK